MIEGLKNLLRWAKISGSSPDTQQFPSQQMEYLGKVADGVMVFPYGYHGNIPVDVLTLMVSVQGNADNRASIGVVPKARPTLAKGEVAFYHPLTGNTVIWKANGDLDINAGTSNVSIIAASVKITGNLEVTGTTTLASTVTSGGKDISDSHTHLAGTPPGNTGVPN